MRIAVHDDLMDDIKKVIEEIKNMEMAPTLFEKAITHSKRTSCKNVLNQ